MASLTESQRLAAADLETWWRRVSMEDFRVAAAKAVEYGSKGDDLRAIGRAIAEMVGLKTPTGTSDFAFHSELGILFYLEGKLARAREAIRTGRMPSEDTLLDIDVYATMWRRVRHVGHWG